jgi:hypothetical protein
MNDNTVGSLIKKIARFEWAVGIAKVIFETVGIVSAVLIAKSVSKRISSNYGYLLESAPNTADNSFMTVVTLIAILVWIVSVGITLYSCYKKQLILYAYGMLASDIETIKKDMVSSGTYRTMSDKNASEQLKRLQNLLKENVISEEEFINLKNQL